MTGSPPAPARRERFLSALLAALGLASATLPFAPVLPLFPCGDDSVFWTWFLDPARAGWWRSALLEPHFIAYRPVTALSFSATALLGNQPWVLHATDVGLHVAVGLGIVGLAAALGARAAVGWLGALLFWASPVGEVVVPFVARRSYSLATALGLGALALAVHGLRADRRAATAGALALLAAALLANETAFVAAVVVGLAAAPYARSRRAADLTIGGAAAVTVAVAGLRAWILQGAGGYGQAWVAVVEGGERLLVRDASPLAVFGWAWTAGVIPDTPSGDPSFLLATAAALPIGLALAGWAAAWSVARARAADPAPLLLAAWALGQALLPVVTDTWFPRMGYPLAVPVALWLAWMLPLAAGGAATRLHLLPLGLVLAARLQHATPLRGLDRPMLRELFVSSRLVGAARASIADVPGPALVWTGMNVEPQLALSTLHWIRLAAPIGVEVRGLTHLVVNERPRLRETVVTRQGMLLPTAQAVFSPDLQAVSHAGPRTPVPLALLRVDERPAFLLDAGALTPVPTPEAP